ncbi:LysM peptidoglycan-binding domain-containing protein [Secundilactobacillus paracollinoides]|uniref:LysM peptidoglycan-binding domain-containing protein n=1 Tax=Secundilactobacillus paracollinoides TaxID=240427 RepID=UPI00177B6440|nr:LysM peptidoglycan-binding domain-containing protein [Secundilactobacillus paracollinoides]
MLVFGAFIGLGLVSTTAKADTTYTVKSGDSLWAIAQRYDTTPQSIVKANDLSSVNAVILPKQTLKISNDTKADAAASKVKPLSEDSSSKTTTTTKSSDSNSQSGWMSMVATAYDPEVAAGGQGTSIPTGTGVAAALSRFPKGTQLEIKYQDGHTEQRVINDTGTFAYSNPNQLDISMTNAQAMQFGRQNIQVRVVD